jgi:hypothetical protein
MEGGEKMIGHLAVFIAALATAATVALGFPSTASEGVRHHGVTVQKLAPTPVRDRIVDDYFRDGSKRSMPQGVTVQKLASAPVTDRIVDDYFRDSSRVSVAQSSANGFDWGDFGIGAATMFGLVLLLAGLAVGVLATRHKSAMLKAS